MIPRGVFLEFLERPASGVAPFAILVPLKCQTEVS